MLTRVTHITLSLAAFACLGPATTAQPPVSKDYYGDPLPAGAIVRIGTSRLKHGGLLVDAVAYSHDGKLIASGGHGKEIFLWEAQTGKEVRRLALQQGYIRALAFSPKGDLLASGDMVGTIRFHEVATGKELPQTSNQPVGVDCMAFSPDGKMLASAAYWGEQNHNIYLWEVVNGKEVRHWKAHRYGVAALVFAPDGKSIFSSGNPGNLGSGEGPVDDYNVARWDVASGKQLEKFLGHDYISRGFALSPDGKTLAAGGRDLQEANVRFWDTATGKVLRILNEDISDVRSLAFSRDGKVLAVGDRNRILFFDALGGALRIH